LLTSSSFSESLASSEFISDADDTDPESLADKSNSRSYSLPISFSNLNPEIGIDFEVFAGDEEIVGFSWLGSLKDPSDLLEFVSETKHLGVHWGLIDEHSKSTNCCSFWFSS